MKTKYIEIAVLYLLFALVGCSCVGQQLSAYGQAPLRDGEVLNLYKGFATWLATSGDALVRSFHNPTTGVTIYARPWLDGWAMACNKSQACDNVVGYFTNIRTYKDFATWMTTSGGFYEVARNLPSFPLPTIIVMPVFVSSTAYDDGVVHAWEMTNLCLPGMCAEDEFGNTYFMPEIDGIEWSE